MAPKLRCPECDHRHPLSEVADRETFRCRECGRALKVPARYRKAVDMVASGEVPVTDGRAPTTPMATTGPGSKLLPPLHREAVEARLAPLHWGVRLAVWIVAVPLGAAIGALVANALGLLTLSQLEDAFLESGLRRFTPLVRFVPIWAIATALIVQGAVSLLETVRRRRTEHRSDGSEPADKAVGDGGSDDDDVDRVEHDDTVAHASVEHAAEDAAEPDPAPLD